MTVAELLSVLEIMAPETEIQIVGFADAEGKTYVVCPLGSVDLRYFDSEADSFVNDNPSDLLPEHLLLFPQEHPLAPEEETDDE